MRAEAAAGISRRGGMEICYEKIGPPRAEPLLLITGMGSQLIEWPDEYCAELIARGFSVVRFDNRDAGHSTHFSGVPSPIRLLAAARSVAPYRLVHMARDAVAVLDAVGWRSAHVVGVSMGGIIAQLMAIVHPRRVRSLTAISSTPWWRIGRQRLTTTGRAALAYVRRARDREEAGERAVGMGAILASPGYPFDENDAREVGRRAFDRDPDPTGVQRQNAAVLAASDLRPGLRRLRLPTLVVHGDADVMIRPPGGRAIAESVPGARLVIYPGLNHDLPRPLWSPIADEIARLACRGAAGQGLGARTAALGIGPRRDGGLITV